MNDFEKGENIKAKKSYLRIYRRGEDELQKLPGNCCQEVYNKPAFQIMRGHLPTVHDYQSICIYECGTEVNHKINDE